jgi:Zn-dependent M16 (insulinase) family peptidase
MMMHLSEPLISFGWLTCPIQHQEDVLALSILDAILMDTDASPLKKELIESGLCSQADAYIDNEMSEMPYVLTCKGCDEKDADAIEELLFTTLRKIAMEPIPEHLIHAVIHQIEFSRLEVTGDRQPIRPYFVPSFSAGKAARLRARKCFGDILLI